MKRKKGFKEEKTDFTKLDIFLSRMASILQVSRGSVRGIFSQRATSVIRTNPLAGSSKRIAEIMREKGHILREVPWAKDTFIVENSDKSVLGKSEMYEKGLFYIQNLSSILPATILDPKEDDRVLDLCAAPGSKTTQLAALMKNKGTIIANDENYARAQKLIAVLRQFHASNVEVTISDGARYGKRFNNSFDKVLLDAPCSGEGLIYLRGEKPLRFWSIKKVKFMAKKQERLIESAFESLKPGGLMVYSTCTMEPIENEGPVSHLLNKYPESKMLDIDLINSEQFSEYKQYVKKGIKKWSGNEFHPDVVKSIRIMPSGVMQGFYIALIGKSS